MAQVVWSYSRQLHGHGKVPRHRNIPIFAPYSESVVRKSHVPKGGRGKAALGVTTGRRWVVELWLEEEDLADLEDLETVMTPVYTCCSL